MGKKEQQKAAQVEAPVAIYGMFPPKRGRRTPGPGETVARIRAGLSMVEFDGLRELLGLTAETLAGHLAIARTTLARRRKSGHLDMLESDRLLRYARLFARTTDVLEGEEAARNWLKRPVRGLGYVTPLEFAETEAGVREVENLLGRIEHGVFG